MWDRVMVKAPTQHKGADGTILHLPRRDYAGASEQEPALQVATVVDVGPSARKVKAGQEIYFARYRAMQLVQFGGEDYWLIPEESVLAWVEP